MQPPTNVQELRKWERYTTADFRKYAHLLWQLYRTHKSNTLVAAAFSSGA
jgi:hypothetical protein